MLLLQAPFGAITSAIALPNPELNDTESKDQNVIIRRAMNGEIYTYTHTTENTTFEFTFHLSRRKSLELRDFVLANHQKELMVFMEWRNENWRMYLINNPVEILTQAYDGICLAEVDVTLQLEGRRIQ